MKLFKKEIEFEKVAMSYLDADPTTWVKSIITELVTKYPPLQQYPMTITWQRKDDRRGYGVGSLKILNGAIPVIVENYKLYPLDVIMFGNASMPLTTQVLNEMLSNNSPFQGAVNVNPKKSLELFGDTMQYSPIGSGSGNAQQPGSETRDAVKVASFIDRVMVDEESAKAVLTAVAEQDLYSKFVENGTEGVLAKLATRNQISAESLEKMAYFGAPIDRVLFYEDGLGNDRIKYGSSEVDGVIDIPAHEKPRSWHFGSLFAKDNTASLEKTASIIDSVLSTEVEVGNRGFFEFEGEKTAEFEILDIKFVNNNASGESFELINGKTDLFIDVEQNYTHLDKNLEKTASATKLPRQKDFNNGDYGVFEWNNKIIGPVTISSQYSEEYIEKAASKVVEGYSNLENNRFYVKNVNFADIIPHETEKNAWYLPKDVNFIPLKKNYTDIGVMTKIASLVQYDDLLEIDVLENMVHKTYFVSPDFKEIADNLIPADAVFNTNNTLEKTASFEVDLPTNFVMIDSTGFFNLLGPDFEKYAQLGHKVTNLTAHEALWAVTHVGANKNDINKIAECITEGKKSYEIPITNKLKVPKSKEEVKKETHSKMEKINKEVIKEAKLLVKEAAVMPDMVTVDAVLSLGLIKSFNMAEYIQLIPDYERVIGELCKLLIMVRMGVKQVPEMAVKSAVESLTEVLYSLKQLAMVMKNQERK